MSFIVSDDPCDDDFKDYDCEDNESYYDEDCGSGSYGENVSVEIFMIPIMTLKMVTLQDMTFSHTLLRMHLMVKKVTISLMMIMRKLVVNILIQLLTMILILNMRMIVVFMFVLLEEGVVDLSQKN